MKKFITFLLALLPLLSAFRAAAVPAYPFPIDVVQPDGSTLTIQLHGDEHFGYASTTDGYLLKQNAYGTYEYARFVNDEIVLTGVSARNNRTAAEIAFVATLSNTNLIPQEKIEFFRNNSRLKAYGRQKLSPNPLRGNKKGLVILVNFTDKSFSNAGTANARFTALLNQTGYSQNGATGCAREYFEAATLNEFSPEFNVFGPYTLSHDMAYYGAPIGNDNDNNSHIKEMIVEACNLALDAGVNFADYDTDNDNFVDNVFVYYAGNNQAEGGGENTIWPHRSEVSSPITFNGKKLRDYACTSEFRGEGSTMCGIGTFCHEFSHVLGLPDLYNTRTQDSPMGVWDIMDHGSYNRNGNTPPTYSAYEMFYLGYIEPEVLSAEGEYTLAPLLSNDKKAYIVSKDDNHNLNGSSPNPVEYFIVYNHQNIGWNAPLAGILGHGLLITRINFSSGAYSSNTVNNNPNALGVEIIRAVNSPTGTPYPGTSGITNFEPRFLDGSIYEDGALLDIREEYENSIFCYRSCGGGRPWINILSDNTKFKTVAGTPSADVKMRITGGKLENSIKLTFTNTGTSAGNFKMKTEEGIWANTFTFVPIDSVIDTLIYVKYDPSQPSYKNAHEDYIQAKTTVGTTPVKKVLLTGKSTRAVKVVPPIMLPFTKVSPYAFQANWEKVFDATGYYVTVYSQDGQTTEIENFTDFNNLANSGWNQTFYTTTNVSVPSAPCAVLFTNVEDTLYSPYYPEAVTEIKMWLRSEDKQKEGLFFIEGFNADNVWDTLTTVPVTLSLTGITKTIPVDAEKKYRRFRFSVDEISKKGLVFDDFSATYNATNVLTRQFVESSFNANDIDSLRIINLSPETKYICKVQATDKDKQGRYENVTDFSAADTTTLFGTDVSSRIITATIEDNGTVVVAINDADVQNQDIYVFSVTGQLVRMITYGSFASNPGRVEIKNLPSGNSYIISLGAKRKGKYAKVFVK